METAALRTALTSITERFRADAPDVSIIIPTYNKVELTIECLRSVVSQLEDGLTVEIIVVDDASPEDAVVEELSNLPNVTLLRNGTNVGFIRSCNRAARLATGRYLCFLNNDTLVKIGWLRELFACLETNERAAVVGSKLLFPNGTLQEAGGIIWSDASGWNYGRGNDASDPRYNYRRPVDYCSGASLLVRANVFRNVGMFSEAYVPAYFEDSDLCFTVRRFGFDVLYEPKSEVIHLEGQSSGTSLDSGVKRFQALNAPTFRSKWAKELREHYAPETASGLLAARRLGRGETLVMIDNYVPEYDKDSGSFKLSTFIGLLQELDYDVTFLPDNYYRSEPYTSHFERRGVEILYGTEHGLNPLEALRERLAFASVVWVGRPELGLKYFPHVRACSDAPIVYDTHDLHFVRRRRELELLGETRAEVWAEWEQAKELELSVIQGADLAFTVTDVERQTLEGLGCNNVFVLPNVHESFERTTSFDDTEGLIFIGGYSHGPNVDAVEWLCRDIMPIIWRQGIDINVVLVGSNPPSRVRALESERVHVAGYVPDVGPIFHHARLMVAPLRYGAGLKGKIGQAFSYGLPTVTTPIGAEGFSITDGVEALIESEAEGLAMAIIRAYTDRELWHRLSENGAKVAKRYSPEITRERLGQALATAKRRRATGRGDFTLEHSAR